MITLTAAAAPPAVTATPCALAAHSYNAF